MRPARISPLLLALALAACEDPLTPPAADEPSLEFRRGSGYTATVLPFAPGGMNDQGDIVGHWLGDPVFRFYPSGSVTALSPLPGVTGSYFLTDINNNGRIVGYVLYGPGVYWRSWNSPPVRIDGPAGSTVIATAINLDGVVVGNYNHPSFDQWHAFRWTPDGVFQDIHPKGWETSSALDVNDAGVAVGYGWRQGQHAVALRWQDSHLPVVEELSGWMAMAVDNDGTAVGSADGFTTMKYWMIGGQDYWLTGPQASSPDDLSETGRVGGWTYGHSTVNPHKPWTVFQGTTTWLPVPDSANTYNVFDLDVNTCGSIVGVQELLDNSQRGVLWTRSGCDVLPPQP